MKILITGANGMVGKNLIESLSSNINYILLKPLRNELNLLDYTNTYNYLETHRPDFIFHCAGKVGGIQANMKNPVSFLLENLNMGQNLILASRRLNIKKLINLSSSCVYPKNYINPLKEEYLLAEKLEPTNEGYALAKITVSKLCEFINLEDNSFQYKTIIPCNLYGKYDKFDPAVSHMVPSVIRKIHEAVVNKQKYVEIWGDGSARREFLLASELANFLHFSIDNFEKIPQYLNVGLGYDYSILEYYQHVADVIGFKGEFSFDLNKPVGMTQKVLDITKLKNMGWHSSLTLKEGIQSTYDYFLKNEVICG